MTTSISAPSLYKQQGGIALPMLLIFPGLFLLIAVSVAYARYNMTYVRLHQALNQAAIAVTKENAYSVPQEELELMSNAYVRTNAESINEHPGQKDITRTTTEDQEILTLLHEMSPWIKNDDIRLLKANVEVRTQRFYRKTETTFLLHGSSYSSLYGSEKRRAALARYFRNTLSTPAKIRDTSISILSYAKYVNIGWEYKDRLITPRSRIAPWNLEVTAKEYGWWNYRTRTADVLSKNGPEDFRQGACVGYKQMPSTQIESPPSSSVNGFDVSVMPLSDWGDKSRPYAYRQNWYALISAVSARGLPVNEESYKKYYGFQRPRADGHDWYFNMNRAVSAEVDCSAMPMLVGAKSLGDLVDRLEQFQPGRYANISHGLAWAFRTLSPGWRPIWRRDQFPREYGPDVDKNIVFMPEGSSSDGYGEDLPAICNAIRKRGIRVFIILGQDRRDYWKNRFGKYWLPEFQHCLSNHDDLIWEDDGLDSFEKIFENLSRRSFRVRLMPNSSSS